MKNKTKRMLPVVFVFGLLTASYTGLASASSMQDKLTQCKQAFATSHQKDATQGMAAAAKLKHLKLMKEILKELNTKNSNKNLSKAELQENVMVMSHLLEMLVTENLSAKEEAWNMNY